MTMARNRSDDDDGDSGYDDDGWGGYHPAGQNLDVSNLECRNQEPRWVMFDEETIECLKTLASFDFPFTFTFRGLEKKFGENVAVRVALAVLEGYGFNIMRHATCGVCVHDLPIGCKRRLASIVLE